ncbi:protogenin-like isoform X2 [Daphnia carinata]|uniref:protogenin-like isoform X2 n=1 Tax=Daphnia carinata TaxID=120202 RepID=UPI00257EFA5C|nr:protogenin-like isoform X2 [Daphnia carinata]
MAPLRLISLHLLLASWWMIASLINAADFYDADPGGTTLGFSHEPDDVVVARGQSARLDCLVRLPPLPAVDERNGTSHLDEPIAFDIHWFQDGIPIVLPDSRRHLLANGSLYFDKVLHKRSGRSSSDEGIYNCLAQQRQTSSSSSSAGAFVSRNVSVRVAVLAREFTTWPNDATAEMGDPVRFACEIESVPEAEITWEKDGVPVVTVTQTDNQEDGDNGTDSSIHARFVKLESGKVLHIYNVQSENVGNYRCVARNEMADKERRSQAGRLVVSSEGPNRLAQFISPPPASDLWVVEGGNVTIECLATGINTAVKWTLNSTTSLPATGPGYLALTDIHPNMAGHYSCVAITAGSNVASASMTQSTVVHVATVPQFVRLPKSQVFPTAKTVRFECEVTGIPSPEIRWFKDGRIVPIGGRIKNRIRNGGAFSELVLSNTVTGDSGIYQCQASNRAGVVSVSARLLVNVSEGTRPEPPSNLKAVALTPTVVMLTWDPPRNVPVDDVKAYTVHYMPLASAGQQTSNNEELQEVATTSSHRVENLKRNANYSFYVRAYVRKSASDPSDKLIFNPALLIQSKDQAESSLPSSSSSSSLPRPTPRTLPSPTAPNVTLLPLTPNTLKVTWRRFSSSASSSSVSFYKIQYRRHRAKEFDIEVVKGDIHEYTITGLHPGRKYDVRVLPGSMNGAGSGQWYTVEMPRVMADAGSGPTSPQSLPSAVMELATANSTSVFVTWHNVGVAGRRPNIHLTYRIQGSRETSPVVVLPTASGSRWITGLKPGSIYEFQLINNDGDEDGPSTVTTTIRTLWDAGSEHEEEDTDSEPMPVRMEAKVVSSDAIQLSWYVLPPESAANVLYYTVRYVAIPAESTHGPVLTQFVRTTANQFQLTNLTAFTLYRISIRSHDRHGRSSTYSSPATDARTMADVPGPPLDLSFSIDSSAGTTMTGQLFWKAPYPVKGNILGYAILISTDPEAPMDAWTRKEEPGVWLRSQLRALVPGTVYHVRMQARTSAGWGPLTPALACPFLPAEGTGSISSVTDEKSNDTAVRFSEQYLGAFIGLAVSIGLAIACSVSMLLRARCIKRMSPTTERHPSQLAASQVQQIPSADAVSVNGLANGRLQQQRHKKDAVRRNGSLRNSRERSADATVLEMDTFVPMLATIPLEDAPSHLDTKGGYPSGSRSSIAGRIVTPATTSVSRKEENEDEEEDEDRSELPLLSLSCVGHPAGFDGTILSQATETTCLSLDYSSRRAKGQGSLHSQEEDGDSSLHSLDSRTTSSSQRHHRSSSEAISCTSDDSSRSLRQDQQDTGMCHADHHQMMNDSGLVVVTSAAFSSNSNNNRSQTTTTTPKGTADQEQQLVIST